jgi:16S rRNA (cytosine1402-N4)-methyltransferase
MPNVRHTSVMVEEVLEALRVQSGGRYIDCTVGEGGHAAALLTATGGSVRLLGIDLDGEALGTAGSRLEQYGDRITLVKGTFAELESQARTREFAPADGVLFDLGVSSLQLETAARGFSFGREGPLDMRFDTEQELSALDVVNRWPEAGLVSLLKEYGEEPRARGVAREIVRARPISTTVELAEVASRSARRSRRGLNPATRTFQAVRIAVNGEIDNIRPGLEQAIRVLAPGGRAVVISYHSLEDRLVKQSFRREASDCICPPETPECVCGHVATIRLVNRKVVRPTAAEVDRNPRSRSARLRAAERLSPAPSS